jgi:hypothetical protein
VGGIETEVDFCGGSAVKALMRLEEGIVLEAELEAPV